MLADDLRRRTGPTVDEIERIVRFCLDAVRPQDAALRAVVDPS